MSKEKPNRYMKNADVARKVGLRLLGGCRLHSFDPGWCFLYPEWKTATDATFTIPDFVLGLLAERIGLQWIWGDGYESHPSEQYALIVKNLRDLLKSSQDDLKHTFDFMMKAKGKKKAVVCNTICCKCGLPKRICVCEEIKKEMERKEKDFKRMKQEAKERKELIEKKQKLRDRK